jgi:adenine-specific DNA-methyltransferase
MANKRKAGNATAKAAVKKDIVSEKSKAKLDTAHGQVFTPKSIVDEMLALRKNHGDTLEPSCGDGAFSDVLHRLDPNRLYAVELKDDHRPAYAQSAVKDFFDLPDTQTFDTIIGNPPYIRHQDIPKETKNKLAASTYPAKTMFDGRTNLYLYFIEKCVRHLNPGGELIFIVPRDFPKMTAAKKMNTMLFEQGTITHFRETGDKKLFKEATPPCCVFRFEKAKPNEAPSRLMDDGRTFAHREGQLFFLPPGVAGDLLSDFFDLSVGGLTGNDKLYVRPDGNLNVVFSKTRKTGKTRKVLYGKKAKLLLAEHEAVLRERRVKDFKKRKDWWGWGREWDKRGGKRVYVNAKTRQSDPFFTHRCTVYDGAVLALFPKDGRMDVKAAVSALNAVGWGSLGFMAGERFLFSQHALKNTFIPVVTADALRAAIKII